VTDQRALAEAMGRELANIHRGTAGSATQLRRFLGGLPRNWLQRAAAATAERISADYEAVYGS